MFQLKKLSFSCLTLMLLLFSMTVPVMAKTVITVDHSNTEEEVIQMTKNYPHSGFTSGKVTSYKEEPTFTAPYSAGSLVDEDIADAENALKMVRFLAGVPYEDSSFTDALNNIAQHGSVLLAASNQFSHYPSQPEDMANDFYQLGYLGCSQANISAGRSNISNSIIGFMYDSGANNIAHAGHRRWILNPGNQSFGIGYADGPDASYAGHRINMHVFEGMGPYECEADSYIAWPSAGAFPIQYFIGSSYIQQYSTAPWSINLGAQYAAPSKDTLTLTLTRERDGKVWVFDASTPDLSEDGYNDYSLLHLSTDNDGYGIRKAIVFRPDPTTLGKILDNDVFHVSLSGISYSDGTAATLEYDINFFDLNERLNNNNATFTVVHKGTPIENAVVQIGEESAVTDENGTAVLRLPNNQSYDYTVTKDGYLASEGSISLDSSDIIQEVSLIKEVSFTISNSNYTYDGLYHAPSITPDADVTFDIVYADQATEYKDAGTYDFNVTVSEEGYYGEISGTLSILPKNVNVLSIDLENNIAVLDGIISGDQVALNLDSIHQEVLQIIDLTSSKVRLTNFVLTGISSYNYSVETEYIDILASADNGRTISLMTNACQVSSGQKVLVSGTYEYLLEASVTLTAAAPENYEFGGWYVDGVLTETSEEYTFAVKENLNLEARVGQWINPFDDVTQTDWFYSPVEYVYNAKLFRGVSSNMFGPNTSVTRGMLVTVLHRAEDEPVPQGTNTFLDVASGEYYSEAVTWAQENGIVTGYDETTFGPNDPITREQIATIFYRYAKYKDYNVIIDEETSLSFNDVNAISGYAVDPIKYCVSKGIITGKPMNMLEPLSPATRAEMATILQRFLVLSIQ